MPKKTSLDQIRNFLKNLASAMLPGSTFALWIESTSKKNKFTAVLLPKDYDPTMSLAADMPFRLVVKPSFDKNLPMSSLDSFFKASNPYIMLRPGQAVTLEWLVDTFKCDADRLHQLVLRNIRNRVNVALENNWSYGTTIEAKSFCIAAKKRYYEEEDKVVTPNFKSLEELYVWADLHAN